MPKSNDFLFFLGIERDNHGNASRVYEYRDLEALRQALVSDERTEKSDQPEVMATPDRAVHPEAMSDLMNRVLEALHAQAELLVTSRMSGSVALMTKVDLYLASPIERYGQQIEKVGNVSIFGVSEEVYRRVSNDHTRLRRIRKGINALPSALLMSIVATFDSNMADVVRSMLRLIPERFNAQEFKISVNDLLRAASIDEIKNRLLNDEIFGFSRGGHDDQVKYIETKFQIEIRNKWERWPEFFEIFERRNLIAHGERHYTDHYIRKCAENNHKDAEKRRGVSVQISWNYLRECLEILTEFSVLVIFMLWRKHKLEDRNKIFSFLNDTAFRLISQRESIVAIRVLEFALSLKVMDTEMNSNIRQMMTVNLASAYAHVKNIDKCNEILNGFDWSGAAEKFRICVAALKKDTAQVCLLLPILVQLDEITKENLREWPVFDFVREESDFARKFEELFREPLEFDRATIPVGSSNVDVVDEPENIRSTH